MTIPRPSREFQETPSSREGLCESLFLLGRFKHSGSDEVQRRERLVSPRQDGAGLDTAVIERHQVIRKSRLVSLTFFDLRFERDIAFKVGRKPGARLKHMSADDLNLAL